MKTTAMVDPRKRASPTLAAARSVVRSEQSSLAIAPDYESKFLVDEIRETASQPGFGYDFSQLALHPASRSADTRSSQVMMQSCPLSLVSPRACPFGGAYQTCQFRIQTKLAVNRPGDEYEQEADRVGEQVMRMPDISRYQVLPIVDKSMTSSVQRASTNDEVEDGVLQRKESSVGKVTTAHSSSFVPPIVHEVLRSPGQQLDPATRLFMEARFGHDFSQVRVHADGLAAESALAVNARGYTFGQHIIFGVEQYAPETAHGRRLLVHELTHVIQQDKGVLGSERKVQCWGASGHKMFTETLTRKLLNTLPDFELDEKALGALAMYSTDMDNKIEEVSFNVGTIGRKVPIVGIIFGPPGQSRSEYYKRHPINAVNHGEGGFYELEENEAAIHNQSHQRFYETAARNAFSRIPTRFKSITESERVKPQSRDIIFSILGDALHVAQDRGAHREGAKGLGHEDPNIDPDDLSANALGWGKAWNNTESVLFNARDILIKLLHKDYASKHTATSPAEGRIIQRSLVKDTAIPHASLLVSDPNDRDEQEADRMADMVMRMPKPQQDDEGKSALLRRDQLLPHKEAGEMNALAMPPIVHKVLPIPGQPIDPATRGCFESRFGHDFSHVRVHTDAKATESSRAMNASAYTVGRDLVFEGGQYMPGSATGQSLLAHELAHVLQQCRGRVSPHCQKKEHFNAPDDEKIRFHIDKTLKTTNGDVGKALGFIIFLREQNCYDANLAAADHYLYARVLTEYGVPFLMVVAAIMDYSLYKIVAPSWARIKTGPCPPSPTSSAQVKWGLKGAAEGKLDLLKRFLLKTNPSLITR